MTSRGPTSKIFPASTATAPPEMGAEEIGSTLSAVSIFILKRRRPKKLPPYNRGELYLSPFLLLPIPLQYRAHVTLRRPDRDPLDEVGFGHGGRVDVLRPFLNAARAGVVGGEGHRRFGRVA